MSFTEFTTKFPRTHVTSWTDDEGFDMVTIGIPGAETSMLFVTEYDHVLAVWDALDGHDAPRGNDPLYVALERFLDYGYADVTPEVTSVRDTPRNVWVAFSNGYPTSSTPYREMLVDMALNEIGHTSREDFFGYRVVGSSVDRSAIVILHKVDPES